MEWRFPIMFGTLSRREAPTNYQIDGGATNQ